MARTLRNLRKGGKAPDSALKVKARRWQRISNITEGWTKPFKRHPKHRLKEIWS